MWRDRLRAYKLIVDGRAVAAVRSGEEQTVAVEPGSHRVWTKIDWCRSQILDVDLEEGDRAVLRCRPNGPLLLVFLYATFLRTRYLDLQREQIVPRP